jgi:3-dehydroquinate dehydratase
MSHLRGLHFNEKKPQICVQLHEETVTDLGSATQDLMKTPFDVIQFHADQFNGIMNFSTVWNAMLIIAKESAESHLIFSCTPSNLPEYFRTERDYANILLFAVQTCLADCVEIDSTLDEDHMDTVSERAIDNGVIPIITIRLEPHTSPEKVLEKMEAIPDYMEITTFHLIEPVESQADIDAMKGAAKSFMDAHRDAHVIIEPQGPVAKQALLAGDTFDSPLVYANYDTETKDMTTSQNLIDTGIITPSRRRK